MLDPRPLNLTSVTAPKISPDKVNLFRSVIQCAKDLADYGDYFVSQLKIAAELYHHLMSIESYNLNKKIHLTNLSHIPHTRNELMRDHPEVLFNIINKDKTRSDESLDMDTVSKKSFDVTNAKSDCFTMSRNPALGELIRLSDAKLISMMNACCPYIFEHAARRNPLEDGIEQLFQAFKIHYPHGASIENSSDVDTQNDIDAYLCYFLNWTMSDFNSLVMNLNKMLFYTMTKAEFMASTIARVMKIDNSLPLMSSRASLVDQNAVSSLNCEIRAITEGESAIFQKFVDIDFIGAMQNGGDVSANAEQLSVEIDKDKTLRADNFPVFNALADEEVIQVLSSELSDLRNMLRGLNDARESVFKLLPGLAVTHQILFLYKKIDKLKVHENTLQDLVSLQIPTLHETVMNWKKLLPFKLKHLQPGEDDKKYAHLLKTRRVLLAFLEKYVAHIEQFQKFSSKVDDLTQQIKEAPRHRRSYSVSSRPVQAASAVSTSSQPPPSLLFSPTPTTRRGGDSPRAPSAPRERSNSVASASAANALSRAAPSLNSDQQASSFAAREGDKTSGPTGMIRRLLGV